MKDFFDNLIGNVKTYIKDLVDQDDEIKKDGTDKEGDVTDEDIEKILKRSINVLEKSEEIDSLDTNYAKEYKDQMETDFSEYRDKSEERVNNVLNKEEHLLGIQRLEKAGSIKSWETRVNEDELSYEIVIRFYDGNKLKILLKNGMIRFESDIESDRNIHSQYNLHGVKDLNGSSNDKNR